MVRPITSFCCGCPLSFGVAIIIFLNFVQNMFYIWTALSNIVLRIPTIGHSEGLVEQTITAAWCLLGLPFIIAAVWGMVFKQESNVRLYLGYLLLSLVLDVFFVFSYFVTTDVCTGMPTALKQHGTAFACGFMRLFGLTSVLLMLIVTTYFVFTVWSYCEDLRAGGCGQGFPALLANAGELRIKRREGYFGMSGMGFDPVFGGYGNADSMAFGTYRSPGLGESERLWDYDYHETKYPPPKQF